MQVFNVAHATSSSRLGGLSQDASIASTEPTAAYILCSCTCLTHASQQAPVIARDDIPVDIFVAAVMYVTMIMSYSFCSIAFLRYNIIIIPVVQQVTKIN